MYFDVDPLEDVDVLHGSPLRGWVGPRADTPGGLPALSPLQYFASDLFAARPPGLKETCCRKPLAAFEGGPAIRFSGERFDQEDLDVFLACLELAVTGGGQARFKANQMLRRLGRRVHSPCRHKLTASLWRMEAGLVELGDTQRNATIRLFNTVLVDSLEGWCRVDVHAAVMDTFRHHPCCKAFLNDRLSLKGDSLAKWLLGLGRLLQEEQLLDVHQLRTLSGSPAESQGRFASRLRMALDGLHAMGYQDVSFDCSDGPLRIGRSTNETISDMSLVPLK